MIKSLMIGIGLILFLVLLWTVVQALWKKAFREEYIEDDVLAGRRSCSNCGCTTFCKRNEEEQPKVKSIASRN
ncbi:MAG: hypothetical protein WBN11_14845 [Eudoraea sp.]|uniref:hypothetical protein n=1 Tax=Eudoraea sp. TaxID=1979955 RepID=UPI003C78930A